MTKIYLFFAFSILIIFLSLALPREVTAYGCAYPECLDDEFCDEVSCEPASCSDCLPPADCSGAPDPCAGFSGGYCCTGGGGDICAGDACVGVPYACVNGRWEVTNPSGECTTACGTGCHNDCSNPPCGDFSWKTRDLNYADGYCCGYGADACPGDACVGVPYRCVNGNWELVSPPGGSGDSGECTTSCINCRNGGGGTPTPTPTPSPTPTLTPTPTPTCPTVPGMVGPDCSCPVTGPLTYVPLEGPAARVTFQGVGNFIDAPPEANCSSGKGEWVSVTWQASFSIENLESIFAKYISDYNEGEFQDSSLAHQQSNLLGLSSSQWNNYNGPSQKLTPKIIFNQQFGALSGLKLNYVRYVLDKQNRRDAQFTYTDLSGQGPALTIKQLVGQYGFPNPPSDPAQDPNWQAAWGRYWDKIPIAANDKAWGELLGPQAWTFLDKWGNLGALCAIAPKTPIIIPEYFRTNLTSALLNQLLMPKTAQSPLSWQNSQGTVSGAETSAALNHDAGAACHVSPASQAPSEQTKVLLPTTLLASSNPNFSPGGQGEVLAALDIDHSFCQKPQADPGLGDKYCMPQKPMVVGPRTDEIFVCATEVKNCPAVPSGPCTPGDYWARCVEGCDYGGQEEVFQCNAAGTSYDYAYPQLNPSCCGYTCPVTYIPGSRTIDIPISVVLGVPYLESVWNKSTSYQDNKQSGYWGFFTPSVDTGPLFNQTPYEKHGQTPDPNNYQGSAVGAQFLPPAVGLAYPDFIAGVKNAENWVREVLWPF